MPRDGELLALKMMERDGDVHYAIGWYSGQQRRWVITANPKPQVALEAIAWVALPT